MPADKQLLKDFRAGMKDVYRKLSPDEFLQVVKDKLIDYVSRHPKSDPEELRQVIRNIFNPEMAKWMKDVNTTYNDVIDLVNEIYSGIAGDLRRELVKLQRIEKLNALKLGKYSDETAKHISRSLVDSYSNNLTFQETVFLIGKEDERARFYANTLATTGMRGYARAGKNEKANIAEIFYYEYVGPLRVMSRDFCIDMVGKTMHISDINNLSESEVGQAFISPCIIFAGGWNCGHDWEPDPFYEGEG